MYGDADDLDGTVSDPAMSPAATAVNRSALRM
jgi:hypothetical protein